jgi:ABC-type branched-subunit amino acid transport system substrate-binding protein
MPGDPDARPAPKHFSMIRAFHLADVFTLANAACGVAGIGMAMRALVTQRSEDLLVAAAVAPALVPEQLPASNPIKPVALEYVQKFEAKYGAGSRSLFGATAWDAMLMIEQAALEAGKKAKPGTAEFRSALRDALEGTHEFVGAEGVYNMSPTDHNGVDARSQVLVKIENGTWKLQP